MRCFARILAGLGAMGLIGAAGTAFAAGPAQQSAQIPVCANGFKEVQARLSKDFAEDLVSGGLQQDGNLLSIFASDKTGTWTIVTTTPNGQSCIVATGEDWQSKNRRADISASF